MKKLLTITRALSDASRLRIFQALETPLCLCQISEIVGLAASTVSKHMQILQDAGLVQSWVQGRWHYFRQAEDGDETIRSILALLHQEAADSNTAQADAARRSLVLQKAPAPCMDEGKMRVLFLCSGNSCRSQMAEAFLRKFAGERMEVFSAGLDPKPIHPLTIEAMQERGISLEGHRSKGVLDFLGRMHFVYLITVCRETEAKCPVFPGVSYRLQWPFDDPASCRGDGKKRLDTFRLVRDEIEMKILLWLSELVRDGSIPPSAARTRDSVVSNTEKAVSDKA